MSVRRKPAQIRAWLKSDPPLDELRAAYPDQWRIVEAELMAIVDRGDRAALDAYARSLAEPVVARGGKRSVTGLDPVLAAMVRQRMAAHAIRALATRAATGVESGSVRLSEQEGLVMQELLFEGGALRRKPVDLEEFCAVWPTLQERSRLMTLVQPKGIYCFYSGEFVAGLASLIGGRDALEIAAGDGTLSRFLGDAGVPIRATDDHSWDAIEFPEAVERLDAAAALRAYAPQVVVCSWPPADNTFEAAVFDTASVETYIVIGNRYTPGWGDHAAYRAAEARFARRTDDDLSALVLPPELESVVYVFERRASTS